MVARGDVWWGESPDEKGRPYLVVSRDAANEVMQRVLVAPVTTRVRNVPSELALGGDEGLPHVSVASFDNVRPFPKVMLTRKLGTLPASAPSRAVRGGCRHPRLLIRLRRRGQWGVDPARYTGGATDGREDFETTTLGF